MNVKNYTAIKKDLIDNFVDLQKKITDFNAGSIIDSFFDSIAREEEKKYIATKLGFTQNLKAVPYSLFDFQKKSGTYANGKVIFSRGEVKDFESVIPEGTEISSGNYNFVTVETGIITRNSLDSNEIQVRAVEIGSDYNVPLLTVNKILSVLSSDIVEVKNPDNFSGGCDEEDENSMLARFKDYLAGLQGTSYYGLKSAVENIEDVRSVNVVEDFTSGALYRVIVYAEDGSGRLAEDVKTEIVNVIEGDGQPTNPGKRAPGINVLVTEPTVVNVNIGIRIHIYRADPVIAENEITNTVRDYINSLAIGDDVILTNLILLLRSLSYVTDIAVLSPAENIAIGDGQIARFGKLEIDLKED